MSIDNKQEIQKSIKKYTINLLSDEVISLSYITEEHIHEEKCGCTEIELESATYVQRLYEAFTNGEIIKIIEKEAINIDFDTHGIIDRRFTYHNFKISSFNTYSSSNGCPNYTITFQSI